MHQIFRNVRGDDKKKEPQTSERGPVKWDVKRDGALRYCGFSRSDYGLSLPRGWVFFFF